MSNALGAARQGNTAPAACTPDEAPTEGTLKRLHEVMFPATLGEDDVARWFGNGFIFSEYEGTGFGLLQESGGPCGVLAAVQAFVLRFLLFDNATDATRADGNPGKRGDQGGKVAGLNVANGEEAAIVPGSSCGSSSSSVPARRVDTSSGQEAYDEELQRALALSLATNSSSDAGKDSPPGAGVASSSGVEDIELRRALELSMGQAVGTSSHSDANCPAEEKNTSGKDVCALEDLPWRSPGKDLMSEALVDALARILVQAASKESMKNRENASTESPSSSGVVSLLIMRSRKFLPIRPSTPASAYRVVTFPLVTEGRRGNQTDSVDPNCFRAICDFLKSPNILEAFQSMSGVMLFVYSLLLSRGIDRCVEDMDDPGARFTAEYGHGTQELLNLLLLGYASSQVHDGDVELGDSGMRLKGVRGRPQIGLVSFLEALRYTEVGDFYKTPLWPIWIVGSQSHYTVLFSLDREACGDNDEELLMKRAKRAFRSIDKEDTGFVAVGALEAVIHALELDEMPVPNKEDVSILAASLDTTAAGIVLWSDFIEPAVKLLQGKSVAEIQSENGSKSGIEGGRAGSLEAVNAISTNSAVDPIPLHVDSSSTSSDSFPVGSKRPRTDSDYARELYEQLNPGMRSPAIPTSVDLTGNNTANPAATAASALANMGSAGNSGSTNGGGGSKSSRGIRLFHYNGMKRKIQGEDKGPMLTSCKLWRRVVTGIDAMASVLATGSSKTAVDDTIRTKWKGAEIEWWGNQAGNING